MEIYTLLHTRYLDALQGKSSDSLSTQRQAINEEINAFCQGWREHIEKQYQLALGLSDFLRLPEGDPVRKATVALLEALRNDNEVMLYGDE